MILPLRTNPIFARRPDDEQREIQRRTTLTRRTAKREMVSKLQARNAVAEITSLPADGESLHIICRGNFPLWSIVPAVLTLASPAKIDHLAIATLGFSKQNAADLFSLIDAGQIGAVDIVASVYFERGNPAEWRMMQEGLIARGQRIIALRSHAKVIGMALSDGRRFAVESSANLRSCRNIEQITLTQAADLHDFHAGWISHVITAAAGKATK